MNGTKMMHLAAAAIVVAVGAWATPAAAQLPQIQPRPTITAPARLPPGAFNLRPLRANAVFDRRWNYDAARYDAANAYLATYLATLVYPEFLDQLEGSPFVQDLNFATNLHVNPARFLTEFRRHTAYLFSQPQYAFVSGQGGGGMDPEAVVISTARAVFVVFRGTDRVGPADNSLGYDWGEWIATDFYATQFVPGLEGFGSAQVHEGFWRSLGVRPSVLRWSPTGPASGACSAGPAGRDSFRACLAEEIRAAGGATKRVVLIGHSLGAAHAQVFAAYLTSLADDRGQPAGIRVHNVYALAAPHVGDDAFKAGLHRRVDSSRIIRFDYVNDPVTMLPSYVFGPFRYARVGTRVYYDDLQTTQVGVPERAPVVGSAVFTNMAGGFLVGGIAGAGAAVLSDMCFHYPQWYLNAAWNALGSAALRDDLPVPLPAPRWGGRDPKVYGGCMNPATVARAERSEAGRVADAAAAAQDAAEAVIQAAEQVAYDVGQMFANAVGTPVTDGLYYLRLLQGRQYLDVSGGCVGENGCKVQLWDIGRSASNNRFRVEKKGLAYVIRNGTGANLDFLEVDGNELFRNGGRVQMWEANLPGGNHNANQQWHFHAVPNRPGMYVIRNVATGKVLDARNDCVRTNGCAVRQRDARNGDPTQVWILERAN